ncbi:MAG: hypothetical protein CFE26_19520 [Verrucomicrobiales bacterium VVV1]|nr:MAG: hypothetical protein CFE26_19520 [Verrucomicrobiales bacterium VVV1]
MTGRVWWVITDRSVIRGKNDAEVRIMATSLMKDVLGPSCWQAKLELSLWGGLRRSVKGVRSYKGSAARLARDRLAAGGLDGGIGWRRDNFR